MKIIVVVEFVSLGGAISIELSENCGKFSDFSYLAPKLVH